MGLASIPYSNGIIDSFISSHCGIKSEKEKDLKLNSLDKIELVNIFSETCTLSILFEQEIGTLKIIQMIDFLKCLLNVKDPMKYIEGL